MDKSEYRLYVEDIKRQIKGIGKDLAMRIGPMKEPVSTKDQTAAMNAMTPQDWARLTDERGVEEATKMMKEKIRREKISDANKKLAY